MIWSIWLKNIGANIFKIFIIFTKNRPLPTPQFEKN